ncbi:tannase and feruloyl esterase [Thozetella sp. PMI_491]|nr:tannase and feruloyl esterase [Thozetella sp. PMI_491]
MLQSFLLSALVVPTCWALAASRSQCSNIASKIAIANTTVVYASHHSAGEVILLPGTDETCGGPTLNATITANLCRFVLDTVTSSSSSVHLEAWFPDDWNGRFLATGGGGLGGCIDYGTVQNGASLGFASIGMNGGHNGSVGFEYFLNKPEVIIDFGYRAMHVQAVVGKELSRQYYGSSSKFNYYVGCSTGGRQGFSTATHYPEDFHGMLLGAPGVEWIRIVTLQYILAKRYGWPNVNTPKYVTLAQFQAIAAKTVELLDALDGVKDGMIDNPTHFRLDPQIFSCGTGILNDTVCLKNGDQVESVRLAYEPMTDLDGNFVYPSYQLGADPSGFASNQVNGTGYFAYPQVRDYFRGIVYNDSNWSDQNLNIADIDYASSLNVGLTNTKISEAYFDKFKGAGGKIISYHGRIDPVVPSELSEWYFNGAKKNINATLDDMNDFYRLFFIPGMSHCSIGPGAWNIGQRYPLDQKLLDTKHNAIMALINWVENDRAPEELIGTKYTNDDVKAAIVSQRKHCLYPKQSVWNGKGKTTEASSWNCV